MRRAILLLIACAGVSHAQVTASESLRALYPVNDVCYIAGWNANVTYTFYSRGSYSQAMVDLIVDSVLEEGYFIVKQEIYEDNDELDVNLKNLMTKHKAWASVTYVRYSTRQAGIVQIINTCRDGAYSTVITEFKRCLN